MTPRPGRIVAGVVVQGAAHLAGAQGCQDAFRAAASPDGATLVLAVADGAGSRERGALGAHLAVDTACRLLAADPPPPGAEAAEWTAWLDGRTDAVLAAHQRAVQALLAAERGDGGTAGGEPGDGGERDGKQGDGKAGARGGADALATTLAAAVIRPPWVGFLQVGDCFGTVLTCPQGKEGKEGEEGDQARLALPPQPTAFLSTPGVRERAVTLVLCEPRLTGVVLATDGCAPLVLDAPSVHGRPGADGPQPSPRFFGPLAARLRAGRGDATPLQALLLAPGAARSGDDLTVLCALSPGGAPWR
ncbi:Protein phosphatase 2C [Kitasatospora sp. MMS16-BH015]|uniref:protein phosphatase 2C domain-containing protein n=1 Tax=Kitasatospora sp. MMS16-BH015 TaxID=2018025 RepID=UPI000CA1E975|nr:protein phosphatase 2C domain-containing protein [Kitasatospora sp. MMS16-BH015]AUG76300.1 Protein phosphatase 2C [Kitasatospora sp. MMS16-BH015]